MRRLTTRLPLVVLGLIALIFAAGCGVKGEDGTSYLALDWVYAPQQLYFPAMPPVGLAGVYYHHPEGTYYGEYVAWDGSYYSFYYTIEVNEGEYGLGGYPGADGMDRYYTMYLYSWGPELYYVDDLDSKSSFLESAGASIDSEQRERQAAERAGLEPPDGARVVNRPVELDESRYHADVSEEYLFENRGPDYELRIDGYRLPPE